MTAARPFSVAASLALVLLISGCANTVGNSGQYAANRADAIEDVGSNVEKPQP